MILHLLHSNNNISEHFQPLGIDCVLYNMLNMHDI